MLYKKIPLTDAEKKSQERLKLSKPLVWEKCQKFDEKLDRGESIAIIQLQFSYICNFRCRHCSITDFQNKSQKDKPKLTIADVKKLADEAHEYGLAHIDITDGEPVLFYDLDDLIKAIGPERFYLQVDTNGWYMDCANAQHLADMGIDKIQLSLDSLDADEHDDFRRKPGSYKRCMKAIKAVEKAGMKMQLATVVTPTRLRSEEFLDFLEFARDRQIAVSAVWPKPVGAWAGHYESLICDEDIQYFNKLRESYNAYDHLTEGYGRQMGCIAVKRMISVTAFGDVMPCIWMYFSLGNVLNEPLSTILDRGMEYFGGYTMSCPISSNLAFIKNCVEKTYGQNIPVPITEITTPEELKGMLYDTKD